MALLLLVLSCRIDTQEAFVLSSTSLTSSLRSPIFNILTRPSDRSPSSTAAFAKSKKKAAKVVPVNPEFSRKVNVGKVPFNRPVLCRVIAKEAERQGLCTRFDVFDLQYFGANITLSRQDDVSILIEGILEARIKHADVLDPETIVTDFDTTLLFNGASAGISFDDATDYDDEIDSSGDIDVGEIASQFLGYEIF